MADAGASGIWPIYCLDAVVRFSAPPFLVIPTVAYGCLRKWVRKKAFLISQSISFDRVRHCFAFCLSLESLMDVYYSPCRSSLLESEGCLPLMMSMTADVIDIR